MDVKQIGNVIIMQDAVKVDGNMFLIRIDCENRGKDDSPYAISYYVIGNNGGMANITNEVKHLHILDKPTRALLYNLGARLAGNMHESEYSYSYC